MNRKITKTEFKKWGDDLFKVWAAITANSSSFQFQDEASRNQWMEFAACVTVYTTSGVIQATLAGIVGLGAIGLKEDTPFEEFDNQTFKEWAKGIGERIKEHCIANGYYQPSSPSDLVQLKKRVQKIIKIFFNKEESSKLIVYADSEEKEVLLETALFFRNFEKIMPNKLDNLDEEIVPELAFISEELVGRVEKLIRLKEQAENPNGPSTPPPDLPPNDLEAEVRELENQVKDLKSLIENSSTSAEQKENYRNLLGILQRNLDDKRRENNKKSFSQKPNDNKLNLAIALGVVAVLIGLICLIAVASKKNER